VLHFHKLDQQRKVPKKSEASRPTNYNKSRENTMSFDIPHKKIHIIDSDVCGPSENWEKNFGPSQLKARTWLWILKETATTLEAATRVRGKAEAKTKT
jgi:hypothetical protein